MDKNTRLWKLVKVTDLQTVKFTSLFVNLTPFPKQKSIFSVCSARVGYYKPIFLLVNFFMPFTSVKLTKLFLTLLVFVKSLTRRYNAEWDQVSKDPKIFCTFQCLNIATCKKVRKYSCQKASEEQINFCFENIFTPVDVHDNLD